MGSRTGQSSNPSPSTPPEPAGPADERFVYGLTAKGRRALGRERRGASAAAGGPAGGGAGAPVLRCGRVCGRWRGADRQPDLRLGGNWLREAGFDLGQRFQLEVAAGELTIRAV